MLKMPAVFSDHMILQQEKEAALFGKSSAQKIGAELFPGEDELQAEKSGPLFSVSGDVSEGEFSLALPVQKAGGPYILKILEDGTSAKIFRDVWFGEVFLAGGQSNMEWELQNVKDAEAEIRKAHHENVRFYYTPKIAYVGEELFEEEARSAWELCLPENVGRWSAAGYFFAVELAEKLGVKIGIIGCNWGGTSASCWTDRETLLSDPLLKPYIDDYDKATEGLVMEEYLKELEEYNRYQPEFDRRIAEYYQTAENPTWEEALKVCGENKYPGPMGPRNFTRPCGLYESMLLRIAPYTLRGFLFWQGENDDQRPHTYRTLLKALIGNWRKLFHDPELFFLNVQLSGYNNEWEEDVMCWPFIREGQIGLSEEDPDYVSVPSIDVGERLNIHPLDKKPVGKRLAYQALWKIFGKVSEEEACGPQYRSCEIRDGSIICHFDHAKKGLILQSDKREDEPMIRAQGSGFEIAGKDRIYHPAEAKILTGIGSSSILLSSDKVSAPHYARYAWRNFPAATLWGANGIPASPFRTAADDGAKPVKAPYGVPVLDEP